MGAMTKIILKTLIFAIFVPGSVVLLFPYILFTYFPALDSPLGKIRFVGFVPIITGGILCLQCAWDFAVVGKGTPAPIDPPKEIVVVGFYSYIRNPMYLGIIFILLGQAIVYESIDVFIYCCLIFILFHVFVVYYEEPALHRQFGGKYEAYIQKVPRWFPDFCNFWQKGRITTGGS
jgi:protein-S-isoprenylcysteine O-methyltransferase Ste14